MSTVTTEAQHLHRGHRGFLCVICGVALFLCAICALCHLCWAEERLPLPADVRALDEPVEVMMGQQPLKVQSFTTRLSLEELRAFYAEVLPREGWRIEPLEWMTQAERHQAEVDKSLAEHRELLEQHPDIKAQVEQMKRHSPAEMVKQQLHAVRGDEHLLLHASPQQDQGRLLVFVNRWRGSSLTPMEAAEGGAETSAAVPTCCNGEAVPQALRRVPWSVPPYPNGRLIGAAAASTEAPLSEIYLSRDSREDVAAYYRDRMIYNGWTSVKEAGMNEAEMVKVAGNQPVPVQASLLTYRNDQAYCGIVVAERSSDFMSRLGLPAEAVGAAPQGAEESTPEERTVIMITYLEIPSPKRGAQ